MAENFPQINVKPQTTDPASFGNTKQDKYQKTKTKNFIPRNTIFKLQKTKYKES